MTAPECSSHARRRLKVGVVLAVLLTVVSLAAWNVVDALRELNAYDARVSSSSTSIGRGSYERSALDRAADKARLDDHMSRGKRRLVISLIVLIPSAGAALLCGIGFCRSDLFDDPERDDRNGSDP